MTPMLTPESASVRACSACSGDYEDPEQTAWSDPTKKEGEEESDEDASAGNAEQSASREGFPAREK
jgi:hypothetical protein